MSHPPQQTLKKGRFRLLTDDEVREELKKKWIQPKINDGSTIYNVNCDLCQSRASVSSDTLRCIYCNVVAHNSCFVSRYPNAVIEDPKHWICFHCIDYLDDSRLRYEEEYWELANHERKVQAQITLAKNWRRYKCRSFYVRFYTIVVRLQITYHVKHRKRDFMLSLQEKLRPIKVRLIKCHNIQVIDRDVHKRRPGTTSPLKESHSLSRKEHQFYFIVTVVDFNHGDFNQTWRINSNSFLSHAQPDTPFNLRCDERMMIGGVSGFHTIVITLFQAGSGRNHLIGQVHVELNQNFLWRRGGKFHLNFGPSEYTIKDYSGMDLRADDRAAPCGSIEFEITTYHGMSFECGHCYGTSLEDMIRTLSRLPPYAGFCVETSSTNRQVKKADGSGSSSSGGGSYQFPMKRMWVAIAEGHLYAYSHFGDQLKLSFSLADFSVTYDFKDGNVIFKLQRHGYPEFAFYTVAVSDTLRWKCAFLASLRYQLSISSVAMMAKSTVPFAAAEPSEETTSSSGIVHALGHSTATRNFDMRALVDDLIAMEAKLFTVKGYRQHLSAINGVKGMLAYSDGHARRFGSTDFSAIQQVLDASHTNLGAGSSTRSSVALSSASVDDASSTVSGGHGSGHGRTRASSDTGVLPSVTSPPASSPGKQRHASINTNGETAKSSGGSKAGGSPPPRRRKSMRPGAWNNSAEYDEEPPPPKNPVQELWDELEITDLISSPFSPQYSAGYNGFESDQNKPSSSSCNSTKAISSVPHLPDIVHVNSSTVMESPATKTPQSHKQPSTGGSGKLSASSSPSKQRLLPKVMKDRAVTGDKTSNHAHGSSGSSDSQEVAPATSNSTPALLSSARVNTSRTDTSSVGDPNSSRVSVGATSSRRPSRRGTAGFDPLFSKEVREAFSNKIVEESEYDDMVDNTRLQSLGHNIVQTMMTSIAKKKVRSSVSNDTATSRQKSPPKV